MKDSTKTLMLKVMAMGYWSDFYVYPVVVLALMVLSVWRLHVHTLFALFVFVCGFLLWGISEYFTHRYLFHHAPLFKVGHGEHHNRPKAHLGTPTFMTLTIYVICASLLGLWTGFGFASCLLAGFLTGYYGYVVCHHIVHNWKIKPGTFLYRYKKFHDIHHYEQEVNFGVSWLIWDRVFGTYQPAPSARSK
jgi:sterol desaturase/sphingolipid hydroxylase (fatty acid hydroxylase superfamily)